MHWEFVIAGYGIVLPALALYAFAVVKRGRRLSAQVPEDKRRYLD
ncbi:MAG: hypothetical protein AAFO29_21515 [Actinomycetota bacterium]